MMFADPLSLAFAGHFMLVGNQIECSAPARPKVTVTASTKEIKYDFNRDKSYLARLQIDTVSPYAHGENTHIGGMMSGEIEIRNNVSVNIESYPAQRQACLSYGEINVHFEIDPTVYVARDFRRGSCEHDEILNHEHKHINADRAIIKKYRSMMEEYVQKAVDKVSVYGPVSSAQLPLARKKLNAYIDQAITNVTKALYTERRATQQSIDSLDEYERVANACK